MPWCPKCRYEYREGITTCADCGCELVDDLSLFDEQNKVQSNDVIGMANMAEAMERVRSMTDEELLEAARNFNLAFDEDKEDEAIEVYVNNDERAEENRTSAFALIPIGVIGIVLVILFLLDIIHFDMAKSGKYMISGVMGTMFTLFFVMGIVSMRNFKLFKNKAVKENNLTAEIKKWCIENFDPEKIDAEFDFTDTPQEAKYFLRIGYFKDKINQQFMNLDASYLNRLIEEVYQDIYEKEED